MIIHWQVKKRLLFRLFKWKFMRHWWIFCRRNACLAQIQNFNPGICYDFICDLFFCTSSDPNKTRVAKLELIIIMATRSCNQISYLIPDIIILNIELALTLEILLVNVYILCIFTREKNRSPVTVLLSCLAVTDSLTAFSTTIIDLCGYYVFHDDINLVLKSTHLRDTVLIWNRKYPACLVFHVLDDLAYICHISSVLITTLLCIQKALAMLFPMWAKTYLTATTSLIASIVALLCSLSLFLPTTINSSLGMFNGSNGTCCYSDNVSSLVLKVFRNESCNSWLNESSISSPTRFVRGPHLIGWKSNQKNNCDYQIHVYKGTIIL